MTLADWIIAGRRGDELEWARRKVRSWLREHRGHVPVIQH